MDWLNRRKDDNSTLDQYLKHHIPDAECLVYAACQKDFVLRLNLPYLRVTPKRSTKDLGVCGTGVETSGGDRWVPPLFGTPGQGSHTEPAERKVLVAGHGPENDDECS